MIIINYNFRFAEKVLLRKGMLILIWKFILEKKTIDALIVERDLHKKEISKLMLDQFIRKKNHSPAESAESHFPKRVTCKHTYGHITKMIDFHAVCAVKHFLKKVFFFLSKTFYFMISSIWFVIFVYRQSENSHAKACWYIASKTIWTNTSSRGTATCSRGTATRSRAFLSWN